MAELITGLSSSDVTQPSHPLESLSRPSQQTGLPWQSGKHSIVSALAKPAYTFDGSNYEPWRGSFLEFLNAHGLRHNLTDPSPKESDPEYLEWSRLESAVCSWLISSVATQIMEPLSMTRPARALWLKLETMYANKSNVSRTFRLYEELFACRQGSRTLQSYYGSVDAIFTNLELYQPLILDLDTLRRYRDELRAGAFLSGLRPELADMIRGQVLGGSRVLPTEEIFAAALRVQDSMPTSQSSQPLETSALIASGGGSQAEHTFREDPELLSTLQVLWEDDSPIREVLKGVREACLGYGCLWRQDILDSVHGGWVIIDYSLGIGNGQPRPISLGAGLHSGITGLLPLSDHGTISQSCGPNEQLGVICGRTGLFSRYAIYLNSSYYFLGY